MTNIHDIAAQIGVSVATVSRALNGSPEVSDATRERILQLARELDYTPSAAARTLVRRRSQTVGVILETGPGHPDLLHPFFQEVLVGLQHGAGEQGYDLLLFASDRPGNGVGGRHSYARRAEHHGVGGVVVMGFDREDPEMRKLIAAGVPCMSVDSELGGPRCGFVTSDNRAGAGAAVEHLHELGHERIATVTGRLDTHPAADRLEGFRAAARRLGLQLPDEYVVEGDFYAESGHRATRDLLALPEPPTAIFAASDMMAAGVLQAAHDRGLVVPDDLAVVGFDDIAVAALLQPSLTTVRQEMEELGRAAAQGLIQMIEDPDAPPAGVQVPARLIIRASTAGSHAPREEAHGLTKEVERTVGDGRFGRSPDDGAALVTEQRTTEEA